MKLISKMKPAFTLTMIILVSAAFPAPAQEHVDVPLPPYDPPPTVSHHGETHDDQSAHVPQNAHSQHRTPQGDHRTKARTRIRTITGAIAEISTIAISTGPGSTANDGSQPFTTGQRLVCCLSETTHPKGNRGRQIIFPFSDTHHLGRSQWKQRPPNRLRKKAALKNAWPHRGHFQLANQAARKK